MRNERVIGVFVASPSDLEPERNKLEEVIDELNITWSRNFGARLDLVRWETHAYPGIGKDAQDVLNRQLPDDYDIFVGLIWGKFGTPTGRAESGTEEEYLHALERFRSNPDKIKVMFYFMDAPISPSSIDPGQLDRIQNFKRSLGEVGTLYWNFVSLEDFESFIRMHLSRQIQVFVGVPNSQPGANVPATENLPVPDNDDLGLIDLFELAEQHFGEIDQTATRIAAATSTLGERIGKRNEEMSLATESANGILDRSYAKSIIQRVAEDMNWFVARVRAELPLFRESLRKGADTAGRAMLLGAEMNQTDRTGARTAMTMLTNLATTLGDVNGQIDSFKLIIQGIPRMTSVLNHAKRDTAEVLEEIMKSMAEGRSLLLEATKSLEALLGQEGPMNLSQ